MKPEFTIQEIEAFVGRGFPSVAARMTKSLLEHYKKLKAESHSIDPEIEQLRESEKEASSIIKDLDLPELVRLLGIERVPNLFQKVVPIVKELLVKKSSPSIDPEDVRDLVKALTKAEKQFSFHNLWNPSVDVSKSIHAFKTKYPQI